MSLKEYWKKRIFGKAPEPKGKEIAGVECNSIFVVQRHDASYLHYDFRLEVGGVLKSWAVPKGLPENTHDKRLAIETEDHPIEYANFEGIIPKGQYGAGTVEIWDRGIFENVTKQGGVVVPIATALQNGCVSIFLKGKRFNGEFSMIFFKKEKAKGQWLIMKK